MNRKQIIMVTLGALFAALPLAAKSKAAPLQPGKYADWNGSIDRMEIVKTFSLADYQRVRVECKRRGPHSPRAVCGDWEAA